jgi:hypothetical protein
MHGKRLNIGNPILQHIAAAVEQKPNVVVQIGMDKEAGK